MSWVNVIAIKESDQKVRIDDRHGFESGSGSESFLILGFDGWSCTRYVHVKLEQVEFGGI